MKYLVIGGTGTLGRAIIDRLIQMPYSEITVLSRCELKQKQLKSDMGNPQKIRFILGDIRDRESMFRNLAGMDVVFHLAALKHIDVMEVNPEECILTNVMGMINVADAAQSCKVGHVVFSSTDKAVYPINVYGMCKAVSEKICFTRNSRQSTTRFAVYRWGNIVGSRGSVIPIFVDSLKKYGRVEITHKKMSRFWLDIDSAAKFVLDTYKDAPLDRVLLPDIKAADIMRVVDVSAKLLNIKKYSTKVVGLRPGEKLAECLETHEAGGAIYSNLARQLTDAELSALILPHIGGNA